MLAKITLVLGCFLVFNCSLVDKKHIDDELVSMDIDSFVIVNNIKVTGESKAYNFSVSLTSKDTGCDQYADWWEVIDPSGNLIYRRTLGHSHVNEQPFSRSGSPIAVLESDSIIVRGHMNNKGYGRLGMSGSIKTGFKAIELIKNFAPELEKSSPLPSKCAF